MRSLGEFDSIEQAEEIGILLSSIVPNSYFSALPGREPTVYPMVEMVNQIRAGTSAARQYVIVAVHTFAVETKAYFADSLAAAETIKAEAEEKHGTEFRIFSR